MEVKIVPQRVFKVLLSIVIVLLVANVAGIVATYYFGHDYVFGFVPLFNLDMESNIPTLFSSVQLLLSGLLLFFISRLLKRKGEKSFAWLFLSLIFLFLAVDETASLHESLIDPVRNTIHASGVFYYAWVIPYGLLLLIFVASYIKFLLRLPRDIMLLFITSGMLYVTGALGFELLGGWYAERYGEVSVVYATLYTFEETLEMTAISLFIYSLLRYMADKFGNLRLGFYNE
ncbi:hypothetical protein [Thiolapillus sp.]